VRFKELLDSWRDRAAAPHAAKSYAVRLPLEEAAQLLALADMFPGRTVARLISELLGVALREVAAAMPYVAGRRVISTDEQGDPIYEDVGPTPRFIELARQHRRELESGAAAAHKRARTARASAYSSSRGKRRSASPAAPKPKPRSRD
jgi:hypothetical protein